MSDDPDYQAGVEAYSVWITSPMFAQFDRNARAEDVMKWFLPPVPQDMMQMQRPLPPQYAQWLAGFNSARRTGGDK